ncbi:MAG: elongation factor Ts, partial [Chloroflexota bacterium]
MDAKRALEATGGDMAKAAEILKEQGLARAAKRAERKAEQGLIDAYIHAGGRI